MTPRSKINYISILNVTTFLFFFFQWSTLKAQDVCSFIKKVQDYQDSVRIFFYDNSCKIDTLTFQLESYLSMFDKLKKAPERKFEVYYSYGVLGGEPIIYTIPKNFDVEAYIQEEIDKSGKNFKVSGDLEILNKREIILFDFANDSAKRAFNFLVPEDTNQGYLQYLLFYVIGEQFALFWHSLDFQKRILYTENDKIYIRRKYDSDKLLYIGQNELKKLDVINFTPIIKSTKSHFYITWYELETHRGIFKRVYKISRSSPHKIAEIKTTKVIDIVRTFNY